MAKPANGPSPSSLGFWG